MKIEEVMELFNKIDPAKAYERAPIIFSISLGVTVGSFALWMFSKNKQEVTKMKTKGFIYVIMSGLGAGLLVRGLLGVIDTISGRI